MIKKIGNRLKVVLTPHDLRRYSATHASRNGVPLEIVSKVILRHQDLKTTQAYLGRVTEGEAIRWMDILHGKVKRLELPLGIFSLWGMHRLKCRPIPPLLG